MTAQDKALKENTASAPLQIVAPGTCVETGEQAKVLNQMIAQWIDVSEKNAPFLQNMHLKEMVGHTPLQVVAGVLLGSLVGFLFPVV